MQIFVRTASFLSESKLKSYSSTPGCSFWCIGITRLQRLGKVTIWKSRWVLFQWLYMLRYPGYQPYLCFHQSNSGHSIYMHKHTKLSYTMYTFIPVPVGCGIYFSNHCNFEIWEKSDHCVFFACYALLNAKIMLWIQCINLAFYNRNTWMSTNVKYDLIFDWCQPVLLLCKIREQCVKIHSLDWTVGLRSQTEN